MSGSTAPKNRMTWDEFYDRAFGFAIMLIGAYVAKQAHAINDNIEALNTKMAAIVEKSANQEKRLDTYEVRLLNLENPGWPHRRPSGR